MVHRGGALLWFGVGCMVLAGVLFLGLPRRAAPVVAPARTASKPEATRPIATNSGPISDDEILEATRRAQLDTARSKMDVATRIATSRVVMYSTSWCGYCKQARAWLAGRGIRYEDHDIEHDEAAGRRARALNPRGGVPLFEVNSEVVHGFDPEGIVAAMER